MKLLAIVLIIISLIKLFLITPTIKEIHVNSNEITNNPEILKSIAKCFIIGDSLIGLFCGLFILFMI